MAKRYATVLVLGDLGRSPRMQYHAMSLASLEGGEYHVSLIGYKGEHCVGPVEQNRRISQYFVIPFTSKKLRSGNFLFFALIKVLSLALQLLYTLLFSTPRPELIIVQNPPSIPALILVWLACHLRGSMMVIDWHNLGFSVLASSITGGGMVVNVSRLYEHLMAKMADKHLCVTLAMKSWLKDNFGITAFVLYDRPPSFFAPTVIEVRHSLFCKLAPHFEAAGIYEKYQRMFELRRGIDTLFTSKETGRPATLKKNRAALVVSSTSWTEDEDFELLIDAIKLLDSSKAPSLPFIVFAITGKGPLREFYEEKIRAMNLQSSGVVTCWLEAEDYPRLMGAADIGVSLHTSTSGIDLPMKVLDMFGCGVPVCAIGFSCLHELVKDKVNGLVFGTSQELANDLQELLSGFDEGNKLLASLKEGVGSMLRWEDNWKEQALPVLVPSGGALARILRTYTLFFSLGTIVGSLLFHICVEC